jgi:hypothetical protein
MKNTDWKAPPGEGVKSALDLFCVGWIARSHYGENAGHKNAPPNGANDIISGCWKPPKYC